MGQHGDSFFNMSLPREGDLPRDELQALAEKVCRDAAARGMRAEVHFKFTCQFCGARCTLCDANTLWETGECYECGKSTPILFGGFAVHYIYA